MVRILYTTTIATIISFLLIQFAVAQSNFTLNLSTTVQEITSTQLKEALGVNASDSIKAVELNMVSTPLLIPSNTNLGFALGSGVLYRENELNIIAYIDPADRVYKIDRSLGDTTDTTHHDIAHASLYNSVRFLPIELKTGDVGNISHTVCEDGLENKGAGVTYTHCGALNIILLKGLDGSARGFEAGNTSLGRFVFKEVKSGTLSVQPFAGLTANDVNTKHIGSVNTFTSDYVGTSTSSSDGGGSNDPRAASSETSSNITSTSTTTTATTESREKTSTTPKVRVIEVNAPYELPTPITERDAIEHTANNNQNQNTTTQTPTQPTTTTFEIVEETELQSIEDRIAAGNAEITEDIKEENEKGFFGKLVDSILNFFERIFSSN